MASGSLMVFTGNANPKLAADVVRRLGISGFRHRGRFSDGEVNVELLENVRGKDVFVLQPTCVPTNDNIMELLIMVDALKRASAGRITAAIPLFRLRPSGSPSPFGPRADHRQGGRQHAPGRRRAARPDRRSPRRPDPGFLRHPVDNIYAAPVLLITSKSRNTKT